MNQQDATIYRLLGIILLYYSFAVAQITENESHNLHSRTCSGIFQNYHSVISYGLKKIPKKNGETKGSLDKKLN